MLEPVAARLFRRHGVRAGRYQHVVEHEGRFVARVDFAWPDSMLVVEVEGFRHHRTRQARQRDATRHNDLAALGWTILRFTWDDVVKRPDEVAARVVTALRSAA